MKISELKEKRIIRRATREFDREGNRIYNQVEYEFPCNPWYKNYQWERLLAKMIDFLPFLVIFLYVFSYTAFMGFLYSIPLVIISGTLWETYQGASLGKKLFKIRVIDDFGNTPDFLKSLQRNVLSLFNFWPVLIEYYPPINETWADESIEKNFSMNLNNKICKTYIVKEKKMPEIKELLKEKSLKMV
ncbi:MAG TPA: hypothetical protein DIT10_11640 [Chryseobacterium sp.]|uniref:RDD family protein n=1 Tax=Chryseobacterium lactis TaxID=1241981 RepID=UPI000ED82BD0|nr:RDD family protein [Chryseobacterium lactis]HCN49724.1 hypothetical protein [Chryseobacterium sp.]